MIAGVFTDLHSIDSMVHCPFMYEISSLIPYVDSYLLECTSQEEMRKLKRLDDVKCATLLREEIRTTVPRIKISHGHNSFCHET